MTQETYVILPCNPVSWAKNRPQRRCQSGLASLGKGQPYILRTFPDTHRGEPYQFVCHCGGVTRISFDEFMRLPRYTAEQLIEFGLVTWEELGLPESQARDLVERRFTPSEVKGMSRR